MALARDLGALPCTVW